MRVHIDIDDRVVKSIDKLAGSRGRSQFIRAAVESEIDRIARGESLRLARASIPDRGHEWDKDAAEWIRRQRRGDRRRVG